MNINQLNPLINIDTHTHSKFSFDGESAAAEMAEASVAAGIRTLALTEHLDMNEYNDPRYMDNRKKLIGKAAAEIPLLKRDYKDKINLLFGIELGQSVWDLKLTNSVLNKLDAETENGIDFILGSVHSVRGWEDFYYLDYSKFDYYVLLEKYFEEVLETIEWGGIDAIAHLTYPARYITGRQGLECNLSKFDKQIEKIFLSAAKNNIALEINTSSLRNTLRNALRKENYETTEPDLKYVKMYRELGGKYITAGSDAHRTADIGFGINEAVNIALKAGFDKITYFEKRKPVEIQIYNS